MYWLITLHLFQSFLCFWQQHTIFSDCWWILWISRDGGLFTFDIMELGILNLFNSKQDHNYWYTINKSWWARCQWASSLFSTSPLSSPISRNLQLHLPHSLKIISTIYSQNWKYLQFLSWCSNFNLHFFSFFNILVCNLQHLGAKTIIHNLKLFELFSLQSTIKFLSQFYNLHLNITPIPIMSRLG